MTECQILLVIWTWHFGGRTKAEVQKSSFYWNGFTQTPYLNESQPKLLFNQIRSLKFNPKLELKLFRDLVSTDVNNVKSTNYAPHSSNHNKPWTTERLVSELENYKNQIAAVVYCRRTNTPDISKELTTAGVLVIEVHRHLLSDRKKNNPWYKKEIEKIHPHVGVEINLLYTVLKHQYNLRYLVIQKRSKTRRRWSKKRSTPARRRCKKQSQQKNLSTG